MRCKSKEVSGEQSGCGGRSPRDWVRPRPEADEKGTFIAKNFYLPNEGYKKTFSLAYPE
jgi:hypothetical protein